MNRLTVLNKVYHVSDASTDVAEESASSHIYLTTHEQASSRTYQIGTNWVKPYVGWVQECSLILIKNNVGTQRLRVIPPQEEVERNKLMLIRVSIGTVDESQCILIPPGQSLCFTPSDLASISIKADFDKTPLTVVAYPR